MKNLQPYNEDSFKFYEEALLRKRTAVLKQRLDEINDEMEESYNLYDHNFIHNQLENLTPNVIFNPYSDELISLYKYDSFIIRKLKKHIDDSQLYHLSNICQNCTINSVNSMDHVLGQAGFPEFCVHPLNLFPSCTECNGYKSASFVKNGTRLFLNLYSDLLPHEQYLFLKVFTNSHGDLDYKFTIENRMNIDPIIFALIENHFEQLNLIDRMKVRSINIYSELRTTVRSRLQEVGWDVVARQLKREALQNKNNLGLNHFCFVLHTELVDHDLFRGSFT